MGQRASYNISLSGLDGRPIPVGEMVATGERCVFRYRDAFLKSSHALSLDPKNMTVKKKQHATDKILFGVFEDSLPDSWGRKLMRARFHLSHAQQSLHLLNETSMGALKYELLNAPARAIKSESILSIGDLARAARAFEKGELLDDIMLQRLFNAAGSPGGAHPKASVYGHDGNLLLVKFPSLHDRYDIVGLEASCLALATPTIT